MRFNSVNPLNPAYVIYTSGSTGVPKGVVVTNESLTNLLADLQDRLPFTSDDRLLAVTTFGFDIAALELLLPLISGGQLIITPGELIDDPRGIGELIADTGATVMQATPALWEGIVTESPEILGRLRILVGGEALTGKLALALRDCAQQVTNVYGPTETTVWSTASRLDNEESARPPIGRPLANTRTYVLDAALRPVPVSIPGELYIAGAGLARGYLGRASLTSERFVANPFGPPGGRMYRTGDLACWRADGELEFLDRVDNQVKIRGFRIELGEIESVLVRHCDVRQAAVTVTQDESGDKRLTAYVVPASGAELDRAELRIYLNRSLPAYMLPSSVITLDELPLTLNGKLDRRALPAPQSGVAVTGRPPRTPHEEILCELFAQLLCLPTVGIDDDFFELGGHSLLATRLVNGIRSRLRIEIPVRTVFEAPTVAALVRRVNGAQSARPALMPVLRPARIPLSFGQRRLWFINRMDSGGATYNIPVALRLTGELDHAALAAALVDLVERHEALRTVFPETSGVPRQCVLGIDDARPALPVTGVDEAGLRAALVAAAVEGFDLTTQPPLRAHLFALTPLEHVLLIVVHHIACDGWSMMPLARDLTSAYAARRRGEPPRWHPLRVQYADYTLWQLAVLGSEDDAGSVISAQARYWNNTLRDLPAELALPLDRPRPRQASFRGSTVEIVLEAPLHERILRLAQRQGVSVFMVLQAALAALCTRLGAGHDIPIGSPISGRMDDALDDMVGFLVNTLVLRTDTSGDPSFVELLARVRETALSAYSNQEMPFEFLVELLNPKRSLSHHPLFQVFLALQNNEAALLDLPGLAMRVEREVLDYAKFDLAFNVREQFVENRVAAGISGVVEYSVDLFDRATIETMVTRLIRFLDTAIANPQHRISAVEVLDGAERRRLLGTWSNQDIPAIAVHERFSQIATARPGSTAVRLGHRVPTYRAPTYRALTYRALTYRELDARANQLAHRLIALGVGPESRVAVFLDRSLDLAVSIVAVLKAGGAYVPLHEAFPAERLEWVMADTAAVVLLTDQATLSRQFQHHAAVIVLDSDPWLGEEPSSDPARPVHPDQLAYVMYTSGSTGTPKGVSISHRDLLALASDPCWNTGNHERVLLHAPYAFDISSYELWVPLLCGGEVVLAPPGRLDAATLARLIEQEKITSVHFTAGLLRVIAEAVPTSLAGVREVLTGGDVVSPVAVERVLEHAPGAVVRQLYGPTEATLCATQHEVRAPQVVGTSIPIGRPLADTRVYVLDAALQPVPPGVIGEIYLAGTGIARGYLNLPTRTAERFLADPCGPVGVRMYRTGDLGRWNSSWQLEFVGRADDQVKIRGFRVEPGEVASVLAGHPDIHEVEVLTRDDHRGERQLIGYVVPDGNRSTDRAAAATRQQIAEWQQIYEGMYAGAPATQFGSDFSGWNSSYNGAPIPVEQMQEWLQSIVDRIRSLRPRRLLEIGVGSGLILSRLAPECETYWATDFSVEAINSLRRELEKRPELDSVVTLRAQPADDFDGLPAGLFDTVVINSVVQYFPNAEYLSTVLRRVLVLLAPGGAVFVGDVRNLNLLRSFHAGVVMAGGAALEDTVSVRRAIDRSVMREKELLVAPEFFHHLCAGDAEIAGVDIAGVDIAGVDIAGVDIRVKRGRHHNELSRYRYDVVLYRAPASGLVSLISAPALRWAADIAGLPSLRAHLEQHRPATLRVVDVPNGRMAHEAAAANAVSAGEPIEQVRHEFGNAAGVDPEIFTELGEQLGYLVGVTWSSAGVNGELDVLLVDATGGTSPAGLCTHDGQLRSVAHTNDPGRFRETSTLSTSLRSYLAKRLPDYMIPAVFVVLDSLPVTVNGKLDREMLPEPELVSEIRGGEPRTPREGTLCALFAQVLGVASVGIDDNFFELGGHSLLAIRLINSIRTAFGAELTVQAVFEAPTVVALVERLDGGTGPAQAPLIPMPRPDPVPLSFAQRRMWFLNRLEEPGGAYNIPALLHLSGPLDRQALDRALQDVVARHESLRTVFPEAGGEPMQLVRDADSLGTGLTIVEITEQELNQALIEACGYGFDLTTEIPCRATLFTLSPTQHVLLVVLHHIAGDGASMGPLARDLGAAYVARASGRDPEFPPLPVQYTDYTLWQRVVLGSEQDPGSRISGQLAYWRATLADLPLELNLPTDRPRPAQVSYRGATLAFELAPALHAGLIRLARERNASLFMVLQAGLAALLTRLGAGTDIPIGSPIAGRTDAALEDLVGFFVNTLVLRTDVSGNPSFGELVERVAARDLKAYANQDVPFELLVEVLNPIRSLARHPLFQVMLALQNNTEDDLVLPDIQVSVPELELAAVKFDLDFDLRERSTGEGTPAGVAGRVGYSTDLFDRATVMLLITRLIKLLEGVAADPTIPIGRIDILDARERQQLLVEWNGIDRDIPPVDVIGLFETQAAATPHHTAITCGPESLTYAQLNHHATHLADHLTHHHHIGPETLVALALPRTPTMITSILAVLKTGAAYLPLDPTHPPNRLTTILTDAHPTLLITTTHTTPHLPPTIPRLLLDDPVPLNQLTGRDRADTRSPIPEHCAAYVIYTSGSTGTPKGVVIPRAALTNLLTWAITELGPKALSHVTASTSWCFDVSLFEIFAPLLVGGQIHIITDLLALAEHQQPAHPPNLGLLSGVPSVFSALLAATDSTTPHSLPASTVVLAGEALTAGVLHQIRTAAPTATILNLYGPTEATVYATAWHTTPPDTHTPPIGHPLPNTTAYVLDPHLALVPSGVPGELYLAGPRLARGYLHQSALTAQRFIANPHSSTPGACMYRTGDLARWSTDGALHYLGRADDQLKIHGHRIEPGEIETILTRHPTITHAAVTTHHHHTTATPHLTAYLVHHSHTTPPPIPTLRDYLRQRLPEYMVPSAFVVLERLPLTPNGKLDRHALPVPDLTSTTPTTPQTPQQQLLCRLFARVLNLSRIGIHDNFFDHGGHSLLANRLINGIRSVLGAEIPLRALFETPTPAGIAERLGGADAPRPALVRVDRPALIPLSYAQRRLWFLNRLEGASATYNLPLVMRLSGTLDQNALGAALRDLIDRHEPLRTVFPEVQSVPHQYVRDTCETEPTLAAIHTSARELPTELIAVAREGFDLSAEPPLRSILFVLSPHEHVLLLVVHHIAADGASLWPLARDLGVAYLARVRGCPPGWTPLPVHYIDYTLWQREVLGSEDDESSEVSRQLAYWRERLAGAPQELALPADRPRPALPSYRGREVPIAVGAEVHQCLIGLARDRVVTTFMVLEAAIAALLTRLGAGADIPIGSPVAGRGDQALDGLVGFFVNTLVLRIDTSGDPTFAELLGRVRESALGAYANQDAPFERLVEVLNPVRALARHPLFQVMFTLQNNERPELELPGLRVSDPGVDLGVGKFDLEFTLGEEFTDAGGPAGIGGGIRYSADLFDEDTAVRISARFVRFLAAVLADPQSPISSVDLLLPDERQMVGCVDSTPRGAPAVVTPGLFEAQVVRTPNRTALQYCDTTLSYRELNRRANRLAHRLIGSGIGPESVVALALPRSPDQIVAVLAVLKAGAAYAPIDPEYPAERISYLLSDAGCCLVLTHHEIAERLPDVAPTLALDDPDLIAQISAHPDTDPTDADRTTSLRSAHPAYLVYTSGSTGRPHGVVVSHEGIANLATNQIERFRVLPGDRVLQFASPGFDAAFSEVCMALLSGAELVLASAEELTPGRPLSNLLARQQITHLTLPPAALPMLSPGELDSLTTLVVAGDALPAGIVRRWGQGRRLINAYGPTETTVCVTMSRPLGGDDRPSIGHPIEGTRAYLLDDHLRPVPPGVIGELYVNGPGLARGYRGQPALTALRFVADPFGRPGVRMYRTGDLVRCDRHGELHFVGRADRQVSVRGFRVEPGEIEAVLLTCPDVAQAAVVMREDARGEQMMVGYVVAADGRPVDAEQLRRHVAASVPGYLVPARIVGLERFPLTPHGKLDHDALPAPQFISSAHRAARTPREEVLCGLFAEILGMGTVGIDDDFFDLGGHSMLAAALISRVHATLGIEMGLGRLFETPTVAGLAGALDAQVNGSEFDVLLPIRRAGDAPPLFCIHPAGGLAWSFVGLTKHVSTQHPIYGLQARGLEGPPLIASSVPEMAVDYLDQIRRVAPHGPYHLLGWSVGGLIAHEVAVLLQARGDLVATLAVLDAYPLADRAEPVPSPGLVAAAARCAAGSYPIGDAVLERLAAVYLDNARAAREFTPGIFRGDLLHFGAEQSRVASRLTAGSWSPHISGNIERHVVKCTHEEMTQSGPLAEIGAVLAAKLAARSPATAGSDGGGSR